MSILKIIGVILGFALMFCLGGRWVEIGRVSGDCLSGSRFFQIKLALHNYHNKYGVFPPTRYQPKPNGPIHSWRVLLLQDECNRDIHPKYDFSQDWNSPNNLAVASWETPLFGMGDTEESNTAHYFAMGSGDRWPSDYPLKSFLVTAGEDRFLLVEYPDSKIHRLEPKY